MTYCFPRHMQTYLYAKIASLKVISGSLFLPFFPFPLFLPDFLPPFFLGGIVSVIRSLQVFSFLVSS